MDIFTATDGGVEIVEQQLDECVLCELCLEAAPPGAVRVVKLYERHRARAQLSPRGSTGASAGRPTDMTVGDDRQRGNRGAGAPTPALSP